MSVREVSERTRIRASVIEAIERDDFSLCGGDVYAKGHLRSIGAAVGANASDWVAEYDRQHGSAAPTATEVLESDTVSTVKIRRGINWSAIMAAALVIAVGLVAWQVTTSSDTPTRDRTTVAEPAPTVSESSSAEPSDDPTEVAQADPDQVVVRMVALPGQVSWVSVTRADGSVMYEGNISDGESKTFRDDKKVNVFTGCASSITLTVNGQDVGSPDTSCGLARVQFTPKDPDGTAG